MRRNLLTSIIWLNIILGVVGKACPHGYYYDHNFKNGCLPCRNTCTSCSSMYDCISCKAGYYMPTCDRPCDINCVGQVCNKNNGRCTYGCFAGYYQSNFRCVRSLQCLGYMSMYIKNCVECIHPYHCTRCANGYKLLSPRTCSICPTGTWGYQCQTSCSKNCSNNCNATNGECYSCTKYSYGEKCQYRCSDVCKDGNGTNVCDRETGECFLGCKSGSNRLNCSTEETPVDGQWGQWSEFAMCSVSCGNGITSRSRLCNDPSPEYGGQNCSGHAVEKTSCNTANCPDNIGQTDNAFTRNSVALIGGIAGGVTLVVVIGVLVAVTYFRRTRQNDTRNISANRPADTPGIEVDPVQYEQLTELIHQNTTYMELTCNITEYESIDENPRQYSGSQI